MSKKLSSLEFDILRRLWKDESVISDGARWVRMDGGRSNLIWRIDCETSASLVCKLFLPNTSTPLFANDAMREATVLQALHGRDISPELVAFKASRMGESLVYRYVAGQVWREGVSDVASLLARLHRLPIPDGLPIMEISPTSLVADGFAMQGSVSGRLPAPPDVTNHLAQGRVFLHGDVVAGNILQTANGLRLIDWQCPAAGDPSVDLAVFLSPAMQWVYGGRTLSADEINVFLTAYAKISGNISAVERYKTLAPLYHWRMAAYCLWKADQGDQDYARAMDLELACLKKT